MGPGPASWFQVSRSHVVPIKTRCAVSKLSSTLKEMGRYLAMIEYLSRLFAHSHHSSMVGCHMVGVHDRNVNIDSHTKKWVWTMNSVVFLRAFFRAFYLIVTYTSII